MERSNRAKRMRKHHARNRTVALQLVSLMDIFTILVFFLLVNSSDVQVLPNVKDIQMPESIAEQKPRETVVVLVTKHAILVQGTQVATIDEAMNSAGLMIPALQAALMNQNKRFLSQDLAADIEKREVTIMGDKEIPYRLLKKVMATCTQSDYGRISLAVLQRSPATPAG
ncbi:MAG: biopolymer transporter ExbD [Proteobacteria bacterium]|nr:biopolymer transporter ExbD [Pseudomonadota bacterium]MCH8220202.1 biopolymer transporter ExbD [Pseudomonadota bacterium]MCH8930271.1 biopolymer transporter ExbD [Pseudomonadota bacterium]